MNSFVQSLESRRLLSAGDLDPSFGPGGRVLFPTERVTAIDDGEILADDKILISGGLNSAMGGNPDYLLRRFNADGSVDTTFGADGIVTGRFDGTPLRIRDIQITADGKIMARAEAFDGKTISDQFIARFNVDGSVDTTFSDDGFIRYFPELNGSVFAVQSDGAVLFYDRKDLFRFTVTGVLDTSFGDNGKVSDPLGGAITSIVAQEDDTIILGGTKEGAETDGAFLLAKLKAGGSPDTTFGDDGKVLSDLTPGKANPFELIRDVVVQPDGKIVASGEGGSLIDGGLAVAVVRYEPNGDLDKSFGDDGIQTFVFGATPRQTFLDDAGRIYPTVFGAGVARLTTDGQLDETFGRVSGVGRNLSGESVIGIQSNGRIIATGSDDRTNIPPQIGLVGRLSEDDGRASRIRVSAGTLFVEGTKRKDVVTGQDFRTAAASLNGYARLFDLADVNMYSVFTGDGDDRIRLDDVSTTPCVVNGGNGRDKINGGDVGDTLNGGGGRDFIDAGTGSDLVVGGGGKDQLRGQGGADRIHAGDGNDYCEGGNGNDRIDGGAGGDVLLGSAGDDQFTVADGQIDSLFGDRGTDSAIADSDDVLNGVESV